MPTIFKNLIFFMLPSRTEIRNSQGYRTAIMQGYRIELEYNSVFFKFYISKGKVKTCYSNKLKTIKQFEEQLIIFIRELHYI
ncbi:hypothetical protein [Tenacibaculum aquimarinum]|uniref:hypothetical protein n=1 Tax=Tenacibaculum aquimarinum TaxID=2910675 RepID=UPI001F0B1C6C|nr:hypothetical protein [Tenacibaculum aquimarinum]